MFRAFVAVVMSLYAQMYPTHRPVPYKAQTARERSLSHSPDWDCYREGNDQYTTCVSGSEVIKLGRVVEVE